MSFLPHSQRGYDPLTDSELEQLPRAQMHTLPPFDNLSSSPLQSVQQTYGSGHTSTLPDRSPITLPKVGQIRCYWALLSPQLQFLYVDPVLAYHLQEQAESIVGRTLLEFVHPDERSSAQADLGGVLESRTMHGSVTRVRFSRLSRVRRELGHRGSGETWSEGDKIAVDSNYMAVDLVINWAAEGLVLCFIHAVVDLSSQDNDESNKTGWTNWCGTPYMEAEQVELLYRRLMNHVPQPPSVDRVFQVLLNQKERQLWVSWPPDRDSNNPTSKDLEVLGKEVDIGLSIATDAKTSCTRRYKSQQLMEIGNEGTREIESIFIPYGSIIFACHKFNPVAKNNAPYGTTSSGQYYDQSYSVPPVPSPSGYPGSYPSHSQYASHNWSPTSESNASYGNWTSQNTPVSASPSVSSLRSSSYPGPQHAQHHWPSHPPTYVDPNGNPSYSYPANTGAPYPGMPPVSAPANRSSPSPATDVVPASRLTNRRSSASTREQYGSGGRSSGNPPVGIMRCSSCKATQSPEWRKGPSGKKDLCNACGLRYARSRAKKEGGNQRRRKDKVLSTMSTKSEHSPSTSPVNIPYSAARRGSVYDDQPFISAGSAGSASGSEAYHKQSTALGGVTPSPSPPSAGVNFIPYSHNAASSGHEHSGNQNLQHRNSPSHLGSHGPFYTIPPPQPHSIMHSIHSSHHTTGPALPRLEPVVPYPNPASFEREKRHDSKDRYFPPTSVSAEGRCSASGRY